jgi:hypothetical protein
MRMPGREDEVEEDEEVVLAASDVLVDCLESLRGIVF